VSLTPSPSFDLCLLGSNLKTYWIELQRIIKSKIFSINNISL
jgi:hypothetical protein